MNVLVVDMDGVGLDFALRCQEHGHAVKLWTRKLHGERDKTGDGLVEKVADWEKWMQWADLVFPTNNNSHMDRLEYFRKLRYPIFGPSKQSADLEINRQYGMDVLKKHGIDIPPYKMFKSLDECEAYCWKHGNERWVFKTLGSEEDKSLSYVAHDAADMITTIRGWKKKGLRLKGPCMLQDFIDGVEMGVSAWMGSAGFLKPRGENLEHKKLMSGNWGPNTGEMGTAMWYTDKSKLAKQVLDPLESFLMSIGHRGDIDMNCIIDAKGKPWPLEFTARAGWPAFFIMCAQHAEPVQWMKDALDGKDTLQYPTDPYVGFLMAQPPFPNKGGDQAGSMDNPIFGVTPENWPHVHLVAARMGKGVDMQGGKPVEKEMLLTTGTYVLVTSGAGATLNKARKNALGIAKQINIRNAMVRDDIGECADSLEALQKHGFAASVRG